MARRRGRVKPSPRLSRIKGWRWYVPVVLLPVEWLLPPVLIALRVGEIEAGWLPPRGFGLGVRPAGGGPLVWGPLPPCRRPLPPAARRRGPPPPPSGRFQSSPPPPG